jgi:hypothetical protein
MRRACLLALLLLMCGCGLTKIVTVPLDVVGAAGKTALNVVDATANVVNTAASVVGTGVRTAGKAAELLSGPKVGLTVGR